jgi:hypothetical protein
MLAVPCCGFMQRITIESVLKFFSPPKSTPNNNIFTCPAGYSIGRLTGTGVSGNRNPGSSWVGVWVGVGEIVIVIVGEGVSVGIGEINVEVIMGWVLDALPIGIVKVLVGELIVGWVGAPIKIQLEIIMNKKTVINNLDLTGPDRLNDS